MRTQFLIGLFALATIGCDRTHLRSATYGQSVRRALKAQVINPGAGERQAKKEEGLDPEEAAIVSKSYRESMSPKHEETSRTPLIVMPPTTGPGGVPLMPAAGAPAR